MSYDEAKFAELLLYIADKSVDDPGYGRTKLNKILFFSDFLSYEVLGKAITGAEYQKLRFGPAPRRLLPVLAKLKVEQALAEIPKQIGSTSQKRPIALRAADLSLFSASEISLVDSIIEILRGQSANEVSKMSHRVSVGWQLARDGETIPYFTVYLKPREVHVEDLEAGLRIARDLDLLETA